MFKKILFIILAILILSCSVAFCATEAKLVKTLNTGLTNIKSWIIKLSTPAAAVAIGTGVLMKKFSFGDEERIITRQKAN
jgi:hypothetical protein